MTPVTVCPSSTVIYADCRRWPRHARAIDAVIHVAALHGKAWADHGDGRGFEVNVAGTKNVLEGAAKAGVKRVFFTSSIWASGHGSPSAAYLPIDEDTQREPAELYGLTKILGEQMCRYATAKYEISTIVLRPGGIRPADESRAVFGHTIPLNTANW